MRSVQVAFVNVSAGPGGGGKRPAARLDAAGGIPGPESWDLQARVPGASVGMPFMQGPRAGPTSVGRGHRHRHHRVSRDTLLTRHMPWRGWKDWRGRGIRILLDVVWCVDWADEATRAVVVMRGARWGEHGWLWVVRGSSNKVEDNGFPLLVLVHEPMPIGRKGMAEASIAPAATAQLHGYRPFRQGPPRKLRGSPRALGKCGLPCCTAPS